MDPAATVPLRPRCSRPLRLDRESSGRASDAGVCLGGVMAYQSKTQVEYQARIRDLLPTDRPRERLRDFGAGALSNPELLAILLRTGSGPERALAPASG